MESERSLTVKAFIERIYPFDDFPIWPPDLFAIAASLVERSGCYARIGYDGSVLKSLEGSSVSSELIDLLSPGGRKKIIDEASKIRSAFSSLDDKGLMSDDSKKDIAVSLKYWDAVKSSELVLNPDNTQLSRNSIGYFELWLKAFFLMIVSDESCAGVGFLERLESLSLGEFRKNGSSDSHLIQTIIVMDFLEWIKGKLDPDSRMELLTLQPYSLCIKISTDEACVQPKTKTAQVGCTIRSLSHHLALLPSIGEVRTRFFLVKLQHGRKSPISSTHIDDEGLNDTKSDPHVVSYRIDKLNQNALNILLVPFPYNISASSFVPCEPCSGRDIKDDKNNNSAFSRKANFFHIDQKWCPRPDRHTEVAFYHWLSDLYDSAAKECESIHGIVMPELALDEQMAKRVASNLATLNERGLEFFICGIAGDSEPLELKDDSTRGNSDESKPIFVYPTGWKTNGVYSAYFKNGEVSISWFQLKHHRWMLDSSQIKRYHLGSVLDPEFDWWERINLSQREVSFVSFRDRTCIATLICEDLARIDPVQRALRSVGPNLIFVLLMDGPQLEYRWPGRYATALADDPGCGVLTLTSMGFVKRSWVPGEEEFRQIALWKESATTRVRELRLPRDHHALLVTLSQSRKPDFSMDGRPNLLGTIQFNLSGVIAIKDPNAATRRDIVY